MFNLIPWGASLTKDFDRLFNGFTGDRTMPEVDWNPRVDVTESDKEIHVQAELPGMDPKDIDVTLNDGILTLTGERRDVREEKDGEADAETGQDNVKPQSQGHLQPGGQ